MPITVASGDTLSAIARRSGVSVDALMQANPEITNPNLIRVGQQIRLPVDTFERAPRPTAPSPRPAPAPPPEAKAPAPSGWLDRIGKAVRSWWSGMFPSVRSASPTTAVHQTTLGLKTGDKGPSVEKLQDQLIAAGQLAVKDKLTGSGVFGPKTEAALKRFQTASGLKADGTLTAETKSALDKAEAALGYDKREVVFGKHPKVGPEFKTKTVGVAQRLGADPDHLMSVMAFESAGTFSPSIQNKHTKATGLIQFMPATAQALGTDLESLKKMTAEQQLDYVEAYLGDYKGRVTTLEDTYMAVLYPAAIGKPNDHVLFKSGTKAYEQNSGLDADGDGQITKAEAAAKVRARLEEGKKLKG